MTLRTWRPDAAEWPVVERAICDAFGTPVVDDENPLKQQLRPVQRRLAVAAADEIIGGCFSYPFDVTVPGGGTISAAGLAGVGISPPAQGRGGLNAMMQAHLEQCIELGDAASVLMASESGIYRRYGYGMATELAQWHSYSRDIEFRDKPGPPGNIELVHDRKVAVTLLERIYARACSQQSGAVHRSRLWWRSILEPEEADWVAVGSNHFVVIHYNASERADGYAIYGLPDDGGDEFDHGRMAMKVIVKELVAESISAEIELFEYLTRLPWCRELVWELAPLDPPLRHFLTDPRQLWQRGRVDMMWLRPLNFVALMQARRYRIDADICIDYRDRQCPEQSGRWRLSVSGGEVELQPCNQHNAPALTLDPAALGAVYFAGTRVAELAAVGQIIGDQQQIQWFDLMMLGDRLPFNGTRF